jgi:predicted RNA binding protein YcfA (HicA-like mRNA interferase family)
MPDKYPLLEPRKIVSILEKHGFQFKSQKGSHLKLTGRNRAVIVPMHGKVVPRGTLKSIIKQAGLSLEDFVE